MDPFTIAAGVSALGQLFQGITGFMSGNAQMAAARNAAMQHEMEAGVASGQALEQGDAVAAKAAVASAANGAGGGFVGSSLGTISQISQTAMFNARAAAYRGRTQAAADIYQGQVAETQGKDALVGGFIGAGSSMLGGMAQSSAFAKQMQAFNAIKGNGGEISPYDYLQSGGY